jgi:hypothetical protein
MKKVKVHDMFARRERILKYLENNPCTTHKICEDLNINNKTVRNDMTFFRLSGFTANGPETICFGRKYRTYYCPLVPTYEQIVEASSVAYQESLQDEQEAIPDLPKCILDMMGYNTIGAPVGGRLVSNEDFHPTPTRVAPHKVHIGNAWGQIMDMAL